MRIQRRGQDPQQNLYKKRKEAYHKKEDYKFGAGAGDVPDFVRPVVCGSSEAKR